jgi:hypothetical protein
MNKKALVAIVLVIALSAIGACYTLRIDHLSHRWN